jgi:transposase InsO family protein
LHNFELRTHRANGRPPTSNKPDDLAASAPNQVYGQDMTYLKSSLAGSFFGLCLVTDTFSRRIVAARVEGGRKGERRIR